MTNPQEGIWCHIEIPCQDVERAKTFYGECFGWQFQSMPGMGYTLYSKEGGIGGGMFQKPDEMPQQMVNYILVDDVDAAVKRVQNHGGCLVKEKTEVPQTGWFAIVADPEGNGFGLWQSMPR